MRTILSSVFCFLVPLLSSAQITQTVRGQVVDIVSQRSLPGATVMVLDSAILAGTATDSAGNFKLEGIPIGTITVKASFIGYEDRSFSHLVLTPSKQLVLKIELNEQINKLSEVMVNGSGPIGRPLNEMATVSARTFSVEEARRFAGSWQDPARAAAAFAGVSGGSDERNDIIIRGNSPTAVLWRLEDVDIPNPNHLSFSGNTGGPLSILNNNMLSNSDFYTGAFPSEYGNANAGVFDLKLRRGNNEKREYYFQLGLNGLEFGLEGPFSKKHPASYLASYRYSTMALIGLMGIDFGISAIPQYQDLTFVVDIPTTAKAGHFTCWGIGGISSIRIHDNPGFSGGGQQKRDQKLGSDMGAFGLSHQVFISKRSRIRTTLAVTGLHQWQEIFLIEETDSTSDRLLDEMSNNSTISAFAHVKIDTKFSARSSLRTGAVYHHRFISFIDSSLAQPGIYNVGLNIKNSFGLAQLYAQFHYRFTDKAEISVGIHSQMSTLNTSFSIEPRLGLIWRPRKRHVLSLGAGMHSQMMPSLAYFYQTYLPIENKYVLTNKRVGFGRSIHAVLGYNWSIIPKLRIKAEMYYQYLYNMAVEHNPSYFSMVNAGEAIGDVQVQDSLENRGTGSNMGVELTIEKFFDRGYYFLLTGSLFNSRYVASDGIERNSAFNGNYNLSALGGYELKISKKNTLAFDMKITWTGGARYTPIDMARTVSSGKTVRDYSRAYESRYPDYFRADAKASFTFNGKRASHSLAFDFQNIFNTKNIFSQNYNPDTQRIETKYQLGFLPLLYYRVEF